MNKYKIPERLPYSIRGLYSMVEYLKAKEDTKKMNILEIGSWTGLSAQLFADSFQSVLCVDPWEATEEINTMYNMDHVFEVFKSRIEQFKNVSYIKKPYEEIEIKKIKNIDIVYIDGIHSYEHVKKDIEKSLKLDIKYISGHDYEIRFPGVKQAVNEMLGLPDKVFADTSWIKKIKG